MIKIDEFFSLIPGPLTIDWVLDSQYIDNFELYKPNEIFDYLIKYENMKVLKKEDDIYKWEIIWEKDNRYIKINFSTIDGESDSAWGGSMLSGKCYFEDIINILCYLRKKFVAVWLHDKNCYIYSVEAINFAYELARENKLENFETILKCTIDKIKKQ